MTIFAFDIGGVIVNKTTRVLFPEAIKSIRMFVEKFGQSNIYIISKAKNKWITKNLELFTNIDFYKLSGVDPGKVIFVDEYVDKKIVCQRLNVDFMIDDSIKVIRFLQDIDTTPVWFGQYKILQEKLIYVNCPRWKSIRKLCQRTSN